MWTGGGRCHYFFSVISCTNRSQHVGIVLWTLNEISLVIIAEASFLGVASKVSSYCDKNTGARLSMREICSI